MGDTVYIVTSTTITGDITPVAVYSDEDIAIKAVEILDQSSPENINTYKKYKVVDTNE